MSEKSKPENTIGYIGNIDGEGIYERLNSSKRPESILSLAMVEDKLNGAISDARVIWGGAALRLGAKINVEKYKPYTPLPSSLEEHLHGLWEDPSNRHAISGFYSMKDALSELLTARDAAQLQSGTLSQGGLLSLLDAFQSFGFGMSVLTDGSIKEDFDEMRKQGVNKHLETARDERNRPARMMRDEANRLYKDGADRGLFSSKNSAKHELKSVLIDFGNKAEVGFRFTGDNIEQTIYDWLCYPDGKKNKKKVEK